MAKTASDLSPDHKGKNNQIGAASQALINYDSAVVGPGVLQVPSERVMTGAVNSAQATEQSAAVTAAGGMSAIFGKPIAESGKQLGK